MYVVPTPASASPAAMELGQRIVNVIEEFQRQRPGTSSQDVRQALQIATTHSAPMRRLRVVILVLVALLLGSVIAFWARMR